MSKTKKNNSILHLFRYTKKNKIQNKNKIIISHYNDNTNIYHIFACEIMLIWNISKFNIKNIIVLKHYINNNINNWRLSLLKSIYKNVYIHNIPSNINNVSTKKFDIINILKKQNYKFLNESFIFMKIPKSSHYIKMANIIKNNIYNKLNIKDYKSKYVGFIVRENNRILYDNDEKINHNKNVFVHDILSKELKKLNIPFKTTSFDNSTFEEQADFLKNVKILIACHGAAFTNLFLLPKNAIIMEVSFRKYWFCDPVCECHYSGQCSYKTDCQNKNKVINKFKFDLKTNKLIYHKADYYNLSQLFDIGYKEILIEDANGYFKNPKDKDYNPINLTNIYIDTNAIINEIIKLF